MGNARFPGRPEKPRRIFSGICLAVVCSIPSHLAFSNESAASCAGIADNMERLACYDSLFRKVPATQPSPPATAKAQTPTHATDAAPPEHAANVAPSEHATNVAPRESEFGGEFKNQHSNNGPKRLNAVVTGVTPLGRGLYRLTLDNGQVWDTTQADWALAFHASNTVTISRMMLGNYLVSRTGEGHSVAVKRVQ